MDATSLNALERLSTHSFRLRAGKRSFNGRVARGLYLAEGGTPQAVSSLVWQKHAAHRTGERYDAYGHVVSHLPWVMFRCFKPRNVRLHMPVRVTVSADAIAIDGPAPDRAHTQGWDLYPVQLDPHHGAGHAVLLASFDGEPIVYDPNGRLDRSEGTSTDASGRTGSATVVAAALRLVAAASNPRSMALAHLSTDALYLFPDARLSQMSATRFFESQGLCGAFSAFAMCLIILNPHMTPQQFAQLALTRVRQWSDGKDGAQQMRTSVRALVRAVGPNKIQQNGGGGLIAPDDTRKLLRAACVTESEAQKNEQDRAAMKNHPSNALVARINRYVKRFNKFSTLAAEFPLSAFDECDGMVNVFANHSHASEVVQRLLDTFRLRRGTDASAARIRLIKAGVLLDWYEFQAVALMAYAIEILEQLNRRPPRVILVKSRRHAVLEGVYEWDTRAYRQREGPATLTPESPAMHSTPARVKEASRDWTFGAPGLRYTLREWAFPPGLVPTGLLFVMDSDDISIEVEHL